MKKLLLASLASASLCTGVQAAQSFQILTPDPLVGTSGVLLYGAVDGGIQYSSAGSAKVFGAQSGAASTNRFGFLGVEQLGDGLSVRFNLESSFKLMNGVAGATTLQNESSTFNRESNVSLVSERWGRIRLGRQFPTEISIGIDPFIGVSGFSPYASLASLTTDLGTNATIGDSRISNGVSYTTPILGGFQAQVLIAPRGSTANGMPKSSFQGGQLEYQNESLYVGAFYDVIRTDPTSSLPQVRNVWAGTGVMYTFGGVHATYEWNIVVPDRAGYYVASTHMIGLTIPHGLNDIRLSVAYRDVAGKTASNSLAIGAGYDYNLSKRSALYMRLGYVVNQRHAVATLGTGTLGAAGDDLSLVALGIRTRF